MRGERFRKSPQEGVPTFRKPTLHIAPSVGPHETTGWCLRVGAGPRKKSGKSQRSSVRFSFLEVLLVYGGEFTLISPVGLVKPFLTLIRGERLEVGSNYRGWPKTVRLVHKRGSKTMEARARSSGGRNLSFTIFVSAASEMVEDEDPNEIQSPFQARKSDGCVKDTRNPARHRLRHPGVRRNCWEYRGCTWRDTQFGRG